MTSLRRKIWVSAGLLGLAAISALGDTRIPLTSATREVRCYCKCEGKDGMKMCPMKMCEIPKYENRWWATSCKKRTEAPSASKSPAAQPSGRRTRNTLDAKHKTSSNSAI